MEMLTKQFIPQISVNTVPFRYENEELEYAILYSNEFKIGVLPGGFIKRDEDLDSAAPRVLGEQLNFTQTNLRQFGAFGDEKRNLKDLFEMLKKAPLDQAFIDWLSLRFVTIGYYCLVKGQHQYSLDKSFLFDEIKWLPVSDKKCLVLDHKDILTAAQRSLGEDLNNRPIIQDLLPDTFTLPVLIKLYSSILGRPVDRGNFRQYMLKSKKLIETGNFVKGGNGRPAKEYRLDFDAYALCLMYNTKFGF